MRILVVEDQKKMAGFLKKGLSEAGYVVELAESGPVAEALIASVPFDLVIMDIMLPDQNGLDTAQRLRRNGFRSPILILTALSDTKTKVTGLDVGADDYLTKPFSFDELLARTRALLRRHSQASGLPHAELAVGDLKLNLLSRKVYRGTQEIHLTSREFTLLEFLMRHENEALSRTRILDHVWNIQFDGNTNVIDVHINALRKKLEAGGAPRLIHTVVGVGYILKAST